MQGIAERRPIFHTIFNSNLGFVPIARAVCNYIRPKYRIRRRRRHERGQTQGRPDQAGIESPAPTTPIDTRKSITNTLPQRTAGSGQHKANQLMSAPRRCGQDAPLPSVAKRDSSVTESSFQLSVVSNQPEAKSKKRKNNRVMSAPRRCGQDPPALPGVAKCNSSGRRKSTTQHPSRFAQCHAFHPTR